MTVRRTVAGLALVMLAAFGLPVAFGSPAGANTFSLSGSMEGHIRVEAGNFIAAGYTFKATPGSTVRFVNGKVNFTGPCSSTGSTVTLTINLPDQTYQVSTSDWLPTGDQLDHRTFQGSIQVPNSACPGGQIDLAHGATFTADVQSDDTAQNIHIRFHYRSPAAKGKGNFDCSTQDGENQGAATCGASWSGTLSVVPDEIPKTGALRVRKDAPDDAQSVTFTFDINCGSAGAFVRSVTGDGTSSSVTGLPVGTSCTVSERDLPGFVHQPSQTVTISVADTTVTVTFVNKRVEQRKGFLEICKRSTGSPAVTGNFQFRVLGVTYTVPVGGCSPSIQVPAGNVTITELAKSGTTLASVTTAPPDRLVSVDLPNRSATVKVVAGDVSTETIATFTNKARPRGFLEICKKSTGSPAVTGNFQFRVLGVTYTVPVGSCSPAIKVPAGNVSITELARAGTSLVSVTASPTGRLVSVDLPHRTAVVKVVAGDVSTQTIVTFTNKVTPGTGTLKICKVAGSGIAVGTNFTFTAGGQTLTVPAGPAPGGYCKIVGSFTLGSQQTVDEAVPSGVHVASITGAPSGRLVATDLAAGRATVNIGSGTTEVTYTNAKN